MGASRDTPSSSNELQRVKAENESLKTNIDETTVALKKDVARAERSENAYKRREHGFDEELKLYRE